MRILIFIFFLMLSVSIAQGQVVEVQGQLKVTTVNQNNAGTDVLVRNASGVMEKRDLSTISFPSTGIVMSETEINTNLISNGYSKFGVIHTNYGIIGGGGINYGDWTTTSTTDAPTARSYSTAIWTGTEMIIWGGYDASNQYLNTGAKYNPLTTGYSPPIPNNKLFLYKKN